MLGVRIVVAHAFCPSSPLTDDRRACWIMDRSPAPLAVPLHALHEEHTTVAGIRYEGSGSVHRRCAGESAALGYSNATGGLCPGGLSAHRLSPIAYCLRQGAVQEGLAVGEDSAHVAGHLGRGV
jgi:hypothetical protein